MVITKVQIKNFRSIVGMEVEFPNGLFLITGNNGAGKSSIIYAIQYALFGRAAGMTKKDLTSTITGDVPDVTVFFNDGTVIRRADKLYLTKDGKTRSVRELSQFVANFKYLKNNFINTGYVPFIDMSPSERRDALVGLLDDLELIRKITPCFANFGKRVKARLVDKQEKFHFTKGEIKQLKAIISDISNEIKQVEDGVGKIEKDISSTLSKIEKFELPEDDISGLQDKLMELSARKSELLSSSTKYQEYLNKIDRIKSAIKMVESKIADLKNSMNNINESIKEKKCKWCGSTLTVASVTSLEDKKEDIAKAIEKANNELSSYKERYAKLLKAVKDYKKPDNELEIIEKDIKDIKIILDTTKSKYEEYDKLKKQLESLKNAKKTQKYILEKLKNDLHKNTVKLKHLSNAIETLSKQIKCLDSKITIFDNTYNFLRKDFLNIYLEQTCAKLSDFAGNILKNSYFSIDIYLDGGRIMIDVNGMPVHTLSAGERQRVRIAVETAFSVLSPERGFIFIDELLDSNLDDDGILFFTEVISKYLLPKYRQVGVVSHIKELRDMLPVTGVISVRKEDGETRIC